MPVELRSNAEIFKFDAVGATISGVIVDIEEQPVPENFVDGKPVGHKMSRKGKPLFQWMVTLDTDSGVFRFYTKWRAQKALTDAARRAGLTTLEEGVGVSITRIQDDTSTPIPAQDFTATVSVPDDISAAKDAFGESAAPF